MKPTKELIDYLENILFTAGVDAYKEGDKLGHAQKLHTVISMLKKGWYNPSKSPLEDDAPVALATALDNCGLSLTASKVRNNEFNLYG